MKKELLEKFIHASINYGQAIEVGNSKIANRNTDIIRNIRAEWKAKQVDVTEELLELLKHNNGYVKIKAAFTLLPLHPEEAEEVLKELSLKERRQLGFEAEMILKEWKKGNLKF